MNRQYITPDSESSLPLVSVIIPNYNHAKYLTQRLDSVLNQSYPNFEVILAHQLSLHKELSGFFYADNTLIRIFAPFSLKLVSLLNKISSLF